MDWKSQRGRWTARGLAVLVLFAAALIAGPLTAQAQDGPSGQWVEVFVGTENNVFVPAECVSGITFQSGLTQEEAELTELSGFQQATITCDTALFDAPDGNEVIGASFVAGSTWFVNPVIWNLGEPTDQLGQDVETEDAETDVQPGQVQPSVDQRAWVELALTSAGPLVYIPATCVPDLPNFGSIIWQGSRSDSITFARENQNAQQQAQAQLEIEQFTGQPAELQTDQFEWPHSFMVTLGCNTQIFNAPGGTAVEGIELAAGQTWFASPYLWFAELGTVAPASLLPSAQTTETPELGTATPQPTPQY